MFRFLFLWLTLVPGFAFAADEAADSPIAVLDVDKVLKAYPQLQERLVPLKQRVAELDKTATLKQVELETAAAKIRTLKPGTPEFDNQQVFLAKLQTELRLFVERERNNVRKAELEIHVAVYREMEAVVKEICHERKIRMVVRQNGGSDKGDNVEELVKWLNRPVVFAEDLDITEDVITRMKNAKKGEEEK